MYSVRTGISRWTHKGKEPDMANHFSALKRARQTTKRTATNRANASRLRTALRGLRETIEKGDKQAAEQTYRQTVSALDKANPEGHAAREYRRALQVAAGRSRQCDEVAVSSRPSVPYFWGA